MLAAVGLAAGGAIIGSAGTARADVTPPPAGIWAEIDNPFLHDQNIILCADDPNGSTADGQRLDLWRCHGYASNGTMQRWYFFQVYNQDASGNYVPVTEDGYPRLPDLQRGRRQVPLPGRLRPREPGHPALVR